MPTSSDFSGLWIPLITPFHHDAVDHPALARLVKHYKALGVAGLVACGSTGEAAALDDTEQLAVLGTVLGAAEGVPVMMGLSGYHLPQTVAWVKALTHSASGAMHSLLVPAPHYIRPSQAGLLHWFTTLANASAVPLVIYDIPYRTGSPLALETLLTLASHPNILAIKDCGGDARKTQALITDGRLQVLAGEDAQLFTTVALGGAGAIAASAHLCTADFVQVIQQIQRGELAGARALWRRLPPLINALFAEPNPAVIKAALADQGLIHNELRLPMLAASPQATAEALALWRALAQA